jgi:hypothetical protein
MSNLYRGPSIDVSYEVLVHSAKRFLRRRLKCEKLTDIRRLTPRDSKSSHCLWQCELTMESSVNILFLQTWQNNISFKNTWNGNNHCFPENNSCIRRSDTKHFERNVFFLSHILVIVVCDRSSDVIALWHQKICRTAMTSEDLSHTTMTKICERKKRKTSIAHLKKILLPIVAYIKFWSPRILIQLLDHRTFSGTKLNLHITMNIRRF